MDLEFNIADIGYTSTPVRGKVLKKAFPKLNFEY